MREKVKNKNVIALVEADDFIQITYCYDFIKKYYNIPEKDDDYLWKQLESRTVNIGTIKYKENLLPIYITIDFISILGKIVGFYNPISTMVHYGLIQDYLEETFNKARFPHTEINNFHLIMDYISGQIKNDKKKKKK